MTLNLSLHQASLPGLCPVAAAVESLAGAGEIEARGACNRAVFELYSLSDGERAALYGNDE